MINTVYAQSAGNSPSGVDSLMNMVPFALILLIMYFFILRPQQKRARDHKAMIHNVRRGDVVVSMGGLIGKVTRVIDEKEIEFEIAPNVKARLMRHMIAENRTKIDSFPKTLPPSSSGTPDKVSDKIQNP